MFWDFFLHILVDHLYGAIFYWSRWFKISLARYHWFNTTVCGKVIHLFWKKISVSVCNDVRIMWFETTETSRLCWFEQVERWSLVCVVSILVHRSMVTWQVCNLSIGPGSPDKFVNSETHFFCFNVVVSHRPIKLLLFPFCFLFSFLPLHSSLSL